MMPGATLGVFVGPVLPQPLAPELLENVEQVSVTHQDGGRSGFQLTLVAGRDRLTGRDDVAPLAQHTFKIGNRVQLTATLGATGHVLMDGVVTNLQLQPGAEPNASRLTVTGEDLSVLLDLVEVQVPFPGLADWMIAGTILGGFSALGLVPMVIPHPSDLQPSPTKKIPQRGGTFLAILNDMAQRWGYSFYVEPGPRRGSSVAYWGPPIRGGVPQKALTWRMGADSNLDSIQFQSDGTKPAFYYGLVQEQNSNAPVPLPGLPFAGQPLAREPSFVGNLPFVAARLLEDDEGGNVLKAVARATAEQFRSMKAAVTASGELDVGRYGDVLRARGLVDVRGVGTTMDGSWYVQSTTHTIARGSWKQAFNLEREGTVALGGKVTRV
jgi:hypothetical protein